MEISVSVGQSERMEVPNESGFRIGHDALGIKRVCSSFWIGDDLFGSLNIPKS